MTIPPYMQREIEKFYQSEASQSSASNLQTQGMTSNSELPFDINVARAAQKSYSIALQGEPNVDDRLRIRIGGDGKIHTISLLSHEHGNPQVNRVDPQQIWIGTEEKQRCLSQIPPAEMTQVLDHVQCARKEEGRRFLLSKI